MPEKFRPVSTRLRETREKLPAAAEAGHLLTVQEQIEAIGRGDYEGALGQAHPDIEFRIAAPPEFPFVRRAHGLEELRQAIVHNFGAVEEQQPEISNVLVQGDVLVLIGTERGRIRPTGASYHLHFVHRFTFLDGALKSLHIIAARA